MNACPALREIELLHSGTLTAERGLAVRDHLVDCATCSDLLDEIARNASLEQFARGRPAAGRVGAAKEDTPPRTIGPFRVKRLLGRGGMGTVLLAERDRPRREVALKILPALFTTPRALRRFELEIEVLGRLEHPAIARIYETGVATDEHGAAMPWFAMEYVPGPRLDVYLSRVRPDLEARLRLFIEVASAIRFAHRHGVLHRDLKPANVLVDPDGIPKVIDFGLARATLCDGEDALTEQGQVLGTLPFLSPEQAEGAGDVDTRTDVHGLGALLYYVLCDRPPHDVEGHSVGEILREIRERDPPPPSRLRSELPRPLDWITARALERDPDARYPSADALVADVRAFLEDEPLVAGPRSAAYRARLFVRRHRVMVGAATLVFAAISVGLAMSLAAWSGEARAKEHAESEAETLREVRDLMVGIFDQADPRHAEGEPVSAAEVVRRGAAHILTHLTDRPDVQAPILEDVGEILRHLGDADDARTLLAKAVTLRRALPSASPTELDVAEGRLGLAQLDSGDSAAAVETLRRVLARRRTLPEVDPVELATTAGHLGRALSFQGRHTEALPLLLESRDALRTHLGEDHPATRAAAMEIDRTKQAEGHAGELDRRLADGPLDHETTVIRSRLGASLLQRGAHDEARLHFEAALAESRSRLPDGDEQIVTCLMNLAELELEAGNLATARSRLDEARSLGSSDRSTILQAEAQHGRLLTLEGQHDEAVAVLADVVAHSVEALGGEDSITLDTLVALGDAHLAAGDATAARDALQRSLAGRLRADLLTSEDEANRRLQLAVFWAEADHHDEARDVLLDGILVVDALSDSAPDQAIEYLRQLAYAHQVLGEFAPSLAAIERALPLCDRAVGHREQVQHDLHHFAAWLHREAGRPNQALTHIEHAVSGRATSLGEGHPKTLAARNGHAQLLASVGRTDDAERAFQQLIATAEVAFEPPADELAWYRLKFAEFLVGEGRAAEAYVLLEHALAEVAPDAPTRPALMALLGSRRPD